MKVIRLAILAAAFAAICIWGKVATTMIVLHEENAALRTALVERTAIMPPAPKQEQKTGTAEAMQQEPITLAQRNNNPLNVKGRGWKGQIGNDAKGHAIFKTPEFGVRAAALTLRTYIEHGIQTVTAIVDRFCEAKGKRRDNYIRHICRALGVMPDQPFNLIRHMPTLLRCMARFESGRDLPDQYADPYDILAKL